MTGAFSPNPLQLAKEVQQMAGKADAADCKVFQKVALVSVCVMAAATASQVLFQIWKQLNHKESHGRHQGRGR